MKYIWEESDIKGGVVGLVLHDEKFDFNSNTDPLEFNRLVLVSYSYDIDKEEGVGNIFTITFLSDGNVVWMKTKAEIVKWFNESNVVPLPKDLFVIYHQK